MKRLTHYKNASMTELRELIRGEVRFSVLYDILGGDCNDIFTDGKEIIICYSEAPYPVWVWCGDGRSMKNLFAIGECIKNNFPLSEYNVILDAGIISRLSETDNYFTDYKVKTELFAYRLDNIIPPSQIADGGMQLAEMGDLDTLAPMWQASAFEMEGYEFPIAQCREEVSGMIASTSGGMRTERSWQWQTRAALVSSARWRQFILNQSIEEKAMPSILWQG